VGDSNLIDLDQIAWRINPSDPAIQRMLEIRNGQIIWRARQVPEWVAALELPNIRGSRP
jgi:hypothetical protein